MTRQEQLRKIRGLIQSQLSTFEDLDEDHTEEEISLLVDDARIVAELVSEGLDNLIDNQEVDLLDPRDVAAYRQKGDKDNADYPVDDAGFEQEEK